MSTSPLHSNTSPREQPAASVVVETVTARLNTDRAGALVEELEPALSGLGRQSYPRELIEPIVVVDRDVSDEQRAAVLSRFPSILLVDAPDPNYLAAKNAGIAAARGEVVALLDSDCAPDRHWLERLVARLEPGVDAVAGKCRYGGASRQARIFSVPDFAYVLENATGGSTGFNINNCAFRRSLFDQYSFDERIRRNGGCSLLAHELRADGKLIVYEPGALTSHGPLQALGLKFVATHFGRGFDGALLYELDERGVLRGTWAVRRFGLPALVAITAHRIAGDWRRLVRDRDQIGIGTAAVPLFCGLSLLLRSIELCGMAAAVINPGLYDRRRSSRSQDGSM